MFGLGMPELLIVAAVFLLLFGGARLPGLMRNMGRSINEFKAGIREKPTEDSTGEPKSIEQSADDRKETLQGVSKD